MSESWYYVEGSERVGPVEQSKLEELIGLGNLNGESYVWRKGFDNWEPLESVEELAYLLQKKTQVPSANLEQLSGSIDSIPAMDAAPLGPLHRDHMNWDDLGNDDCVISIKVGYDRGSDEAEYGPFSTNQLEQAYNENRISDKTYVFVPGMKNWEFIGDTPLLERISGNSFPPEIKEEDRRIGLRKPFVARLFFHDQENVFEGICRDISVGGLQVLVSGYPGNIGDMVNMNVHPDNSEYCFVATGRIVRVLDGGQGFSLRFEGLNENAAHSIQNYIQSN